MKYSFLMNNLEKRIYTYWYSFTNDISTPAKEPDFIKVRLEIGDRIVYDKVCFQERDNPNSKHIVHGSGCVSLQDLGLRERTLKDNLRKESQYLGSGYLHA